MDEESSFFIPSCIVSHHVGVPDLKFANEGFDLEILHWTLKVVESQKFGVKQAQLVKKGVFLHDF